VAMTIEEIIAELTRAHEASTQGEWTGYRLVHADRGDTMTPEEMGEYVRNSVIKSESESGTRDFIAVLGNKPDGPADVCHVGNGPTSPANAAFIVAAHNHLGALLAYVREQSELVRALERFERATTVPEPWDDAAATEYMQAGDALDALRARGGK
jgi:hypothetical protein